MEKARLCPEAELCASLQNVLESGLSTALKPRETNDCCKNQADECFAATLL